jgi:hypothetical protein
MKLPLATKYKMAELEVHPGLHPANRLALCVIASRRVKSVERVLHTDDIVPLAAPLQQQVELMFRVDIGRLVADVEMVLAAADVQAEINTAPITRVCRIKFREKIGELVGERRRRGEENRQNGSRNSTAERFHSRPQGCDRFVRYCQAKTLSAREFEQLANPRLE